MRLHGGLDPTNHASLYKPLNPQEKPEGLRGARREGEQINRRLDEAYVTKEKEAGVIANPRELEIKGRAGLVEAASGWNGFRERNLCSFFARSAESDQK